MFKSMLKNILGMFVAVFSVVSVSHAEIAYSMPAIEAGFKLNSVDVENSTSNKQSQAFQAGGSIVIDFAKEHSQFGLKSGLMYTERTFKADLVGSSISGKMTYAEVPLHLMFKLEDYAGIYFGPSFAMKLGDECSNSDGTTCALSNISSTIMPLTFGAQFKIASNFGLNLFFETVSDDLAQGLKSSRAVGMNFMFTLD